MSKFDSGMNVLIIDEEHTVRRGVITNAYDELKIAVVAFQDGAVEKVPYSMLGIDKAADTPTEEKETVESVRITPYGFMKHVIYIAFSTSVTAVANEDPMELSYSVIVSGLELMEAIFPNHDGIDLTKERLKEELINIVINAELEVKPVVMLNSLILRDLIGRIFN